MDRTETSSRKLITIFIVQLIVNDYTKSEREKKLETKIYAPNCFFLCDYVCMVFVCVFLCVILTQSLHSYRNSTIWNANRVFSWMVLMIWAKHSISNIQVYSSSKRSKHVTTQMNWNDFQITCIEKSYRKELNWNCLTVELQSLYRQLVLNENIMRKWKALKLSWFKMIFFEWYMHSYVGRFAFPMNVNK